MTAVSVQQLHWSAAYPLDGALCGLEEQRECRTTVDVSVPMYKIVRTANGRLMRVTTTFFQRIGTSFLNVGDVPPLLETVGPESAEGLAVWRS